MITAIVLINAERRQINAMAEQLAAMSGISEVYSVSGNYDLIALVRVATNDALAELVTQHILNLEGVLKSETLLAFQAFSRHDLESMFSIGE